MGIPPSIRSARLEKWAVSQGGLRTGCLAAKEDGVTETRGDSPTVLQCRRGGGRRGRAGVAHKLRTHCASNPSLCQLRRTALSCLGDAEVLRFCVAGHSGRCGERFDELA